MGTVNIEERGDVAVVRLNLGVTNPVGSELVDDLSAALDEVAGRAKGMVLAGGEKFFSIGLNLPELVKLDRSGFEDFWKRFMGVTLKLYELPVVTVAAIEGHAPAAGTVFALACDYRFAAEGKKMLGLNEIKLGIPVPYLPDMFLRQIVGDRIATELLYNGEFLLPEGALKQGMIDEVHAMEDMLDKAVEKASTIAAYESGAFAAIKFTRTEEIAARYIQHADRVNGAFYECWFSEATQKLLVEAAEKF